MRHKVNNFCAFLREHLCCHRARRILSLLGQRLWRGHRGRAIARKEFEMRILPDPTLRENSLVWEQIQLESEPPRQKRGIYLEYVLGGHPITWNARNNSKRSIGNRCGMYRDVSFYVNSLNQRVQWDTPDFWREALKAEYQTRELFRKLGYSPPIISIATKIQGLWRARRARHYFHYVIKARRIAQTSAKAYSDNPSSIKAICNHALTLHVWHHDYERARPIYQKMMHFMDRRGIDNSFVLYSYSIFCAITGDRGWDEISRFTLRARAASRTCLGTSSFSQAAVGFFLQMALHSQSDDERGWHNYALCRMLVYDDLLGANSAFLKALSANPDCLKVISNYKYFLNEYHATPIADQCLKDTKIIQK